MEKESIVGESNTLESEDIWIKPHLTPSRT